MGIPLVASTLWSGSAMILLGAPSSVKLRRLHFECSTGQNCRTAGVVRPRISHDNYRIMRDKHNNKLTKV